MSLYKSSKGFIREKVSPTWWGRLSRGRAHTKRFFRENIWKLQHPGNDFYCPYCKNEYGKLIPYINPYEISAKADIISGQSISAYACPHCLSNDRERALYFFINKKDDFLSNKKILHFAPEKNLYSFLSSANSAEYVCADLDPKNYAHLSNEIEKIDITDIAYPDESFDIVICNHVLEHIPDDIRAMKEIFRVLKKSGTAILMVPIGAKLDDTYEDPTKTTEEERSVSFGQYDHVRIYAEKNYIERLRSSGFQVDAHALDIDAEKTAKYGLNSREKIYLGFKN